MIPELQEILFVSRRLLDFVDYEVELYIVTIMLTLYLLFVLSWSSTIFKSLFNPEGVIRASENKEKLFSIDSLYLNLHMLC